MGDELTEQDLLDAWRRLNVQEMPEITTVPINPRNWQRLVEACVAEGLDPVEVLRARGLDVVIEQS